MTFDYHTAQIFKEDKVEDRGEMSDVLILTKTKMISIECKFLSNFSIQKDVDSVQKRIQKFSAHYKLAPLQVLLLKEDKWQRSGKLSGKLETFNPAIPIIVIFWDELEPLISTRQVNTYLKSQINREIRLGLPDKNTL